MKRITPLAVLICIASFGFAQNAQSLEGTWILSVVDNILPDGTRVHLYGDRPSGILVFDSHGQYALQIMSGDRRKFASGDKAQGTSDEYKAAMTGINTHFGKYTVNATDNTITFSIEHASYPNWEGTIQKRPYTITETEFKYTVPAPTTGANSGARGEVVWVRATH